MTGHLRRFPGRPLGERTNNPTSTRPAHKAPSPPADASGVRRRGHVAGADAYEEGAARRAPLRLDPQPGGTRLRQPVEGADAMAAAAAAAELRQDLSPPPAWEAAPAHHPPGPACTSRRRRRPVVAVAEGSIEGLSAGGGGGGLDSVRGQLCLPPGQGSGQPGRRAANSSSRRTRVTFAATPPSAQHPRRAAVAVTPRVMPAVARQAWAAWRGVARTGARQLRSVVWMLRRRQQRCFRHWLLLHVAPRPPRSRADRPGPAHDQQRADLVLQRVVSLLHRRRARLFGSWAALAWQRRARRLERGAALLRARRGVRLRAVARALVAWHEWVARQRVRQAVARQRSMQMARRHAARSSGLWRAAVFAAWRSLSLSHLRLNLLGWQLHERAQQQQRRHCLRSWRQAYAGSVRERAVAGLRRRRALRRGWAAWALACAVRVHRRRLLDGILQLRLRACRQGAGRALAHWARRCRGGAMAAARHAALARSFRGWVRALAAARRRRRLGAAAEGHRRRCLRRCLATAWGGWQRQRRLGGAARRAAGALAAGRVVLCAQSALRHWRGVPAARSGRAQQLRRCHELRRAQRWLGGWHAAGAEQRQRRAAAERRVQRGGGLRRGRRVVCAWRACAERRRTARRSGLILEGRVRAGRRRVGLEGWLGAVRVRRLREALRIGVAERALRGWCRVAQVLRRRARNALGMATH
jgi:hypothetical protein